MRSCGNKKTREEEKESTTAFLKSLGAGFLSAAQSVGYSAAFDGFVFHIRSNHPNTQLLKQKIKQEFGDKVLIRYDDTNKVNL